MALYKNSAYLKTSTSADFDKLHSPGAGTPHSGIYRCEGCAREIAANQGNPLPPQNHHQHTTAQGTVRWRMIIYAE